MRTLWEHIAFCQNIFDGNLANSWDNTDCDAMDD
jgi:hypothetical protein